jgi:uncharacterized membrane protein
MKKWVKGIFGTLGASALIAFGFELWLSYNHTPIANFNVLAVSSLITIVIVVVVALALVFVMVLFWIFLREKQDRSEERRYNAHSRSEERYYNALSQQQMARVAESALVSAQVANYLATQIAQGMRLVERDGREMLALPGKRALVPVEETDLTDDELDFIDEEQQKYD